LWKEHSQPGFDIDAEMARLAGLSIDLGSIADPGADHLFAG